MTAVWSRDRNGIISQPLHCASFHIRIFICCITRAVFNWRIPRSLLITTAKNAWTTRSIRFVMLMSMASCNFFLLYLVRIIACPFRMGEVLCNNTRWIRTHKIAYQFVSHPFCRIYFLPISVLYIFSIVHKSLHL